MHYGRIETITIDAQQTICSSTSIGGLTTNVANESWHGKYFKQFKEFVRNKQQETTAAYKFDA